MSLVESLLRTHLPPLRSNPQGWLTMNCPMCVHNGQPRADTRHRGGFKFDGERIGYHCFNCNYTTGWRPGSRLGFKLIKLMRILGIDEGEIQRLKIQLWDQVEEDIDAEPAVFKVDWPSIEFPWPVSMDISDQAKQYLDSRHVLGLATFLQTESKVLGMENRVILPYTYGDKIVGYQARWIGTPPDRKTPKMISHRPPGYVFNLDTQNRKRKYTVVVEGEYDALSIGGVALMTNSINPEQAKVIEDLDTEPVVVADRDRAGRELLEQSAILGWSASFPDWPDDVKDANDAVQRFGRIATLQSILTAIESNPLKIKLLARRWCV